MAWGRLALIEAAKVSPQALEQVAKVFQYEKQLPDTHEIKQDLFNEHALSDVHPNSPPQASNKRSTGSFVRITKIEPLEPEQERSHDYLYDPKQVLNPNNSAAGTYQFEQARPLLTSAQLIPFLHSSLGLKQVGNKIDQRVVGRLVTKGRPIQCLPLKQVQRWSQQLQIIVDTGEHLRPYWSDFEQIVELLKQVLGSNNVTAVRLRERGYYRSKPLCIEWPSQKNTEWRSWTAPATEVPILILSDFGVSDKTGNESGLWWRFSKELISHPAPVITLSPVSSTPLNPAACQRLSISPLVDGVQLPRHALTGFKLKLLSLDAINEILVMLSPLPVIDIGLLRKLRDQFNWGPSYIESQIWNHSDMQRSSLGVRLKPALAKGYVKKFRRQVKKEDAEKLWNIVAQHHKNAHQGLRQLELIGQSVTSETDNEQVRNYLKQLCASTAQSIKGSAQHQALVMQCKTYLASQPDDIWKGALEDVFYDLCAMAYEFEIKAGDLPPTLGEHFRPDRLKWLLDDSERQETVSWSVRQIGVKGEICFEQVNTSGAIVSPVYRFDALKKMPPTLHLQNGTVRPLHDGLICKTEQLTSVEVRTETEIVHFDMMQKPDWAAALGRDQYGLYADINLTPDHLQRFRWIPAGTFLMGSPESEPERNDDETQHLVTLTKGYWLADSTVTQDQWQAIMTRVPSYFRGKSLPVERVSWDGAQGFIQLINSQHSLLEFKLPSEAEWEYACRAGTTTPFIYGENITPKQVNYDATKPYNNGEEGEYRRQTVTVKSLAANPWGLFEMHGNVWEWCLDEWNKDLGTAPVTDPIMQFGDPGTFRAVRGGGWHQEGDRVRSSCRNFYSSDNSRSDLGFRLILVSPSASTCDDAIDPSSSIVPSKTLYPSETLLPSAVFTDDGKGTSPPEYYDSSQKEDFGQNETLESSRDPITLEDENSELVSLFVSYPHADWYLIEKVEACLKDINKPKVIVKTKFDSDMSLGQKIVKHVMEEMKGADIVVLLVNNQYKGSAHAAIQMKQLLANNNAGDPIVVPIIIEKVESLDEDYFKSIQALPSGAKPLNEWPSPDEFWDDVKSGLRVTIKKEFERKQRDSAKKMEK